MSENDKRTIDAGIAWNLLTSLTFIVAEAGSVMRDIYDTDFVVLYKEDLAPLTKADERVYTIILTGLRGLSPGLSILSEEGKGWDTTRRIS